MNRAAAAHGCVADVNPAEDHGFMYSRDSPIQMGTGGRFFWMNPEAMSPAAPQG